MNEIKEYNDLSINKYGTIGSLMNGYLDSYLNREEIEVINKNIDILNKKLEDFNIFKYIMHIKKNQEVKIPLFNYNVNFLAVSKYLRSKS